MSQHSILDININNPPSADDDEKRRSNSGKRKSDEDTLKRRSAKGFVNFYDLGQRLVSGVFTDIPYVSAFTGVEISETTYAELAEVIFTIPEDEWKDQYKKLGFEDAYLYGLDWVFDPQDASNISIIGKHGSRPSIHDEEVLGIDHWSAKGLNAHNGEFLIESSGLFHDIGSYEIPGNHISVKITDVRDVDADAVEFPTNCAGMDLFLMPSQAQAIISTADGDFISRIHCLPRQYFLQPGVFPEFRAMTIVIIIAGFNDEISPTVRGFVDTNAIKDAAVWYASNMPVFDSVPTLSGTGELLLFPNNKPVVGALIAVAHLKGRSYYMWGELGNTTASNWFLSSRSIVF